MGGKITVVGLGPGAAGNLSLETMDLLKSDAQVILRTAVHPTVATLKEQGVVFSSCDDLYEAGASFEEVYGKVVARVLESAKEQDVVYAVPGSPLVAERTVVLLRDAAKEQKLALTIKPAMSFLDLAYVELGIDPIAGLRIIDAQDFAAVEDAGNYPLMITQVYSKLVASDLKIALMDQLDDEYEIYFLRNLGLPDEECRPVKLFELDRQEHIDHLTSVYVPPMAEGSAAGVTFFDEEEEEDDGATIVNYAEDYEDEYAEEDEESEVEQAVAEILGTASFDEFDIQPLADVMRVLREPDGCPWDREQTFESIRANLIEEAYEYIEAVDNKDTEGMCEELGDVLMQVVFHARMAQEQGLFDLQDVIDHVTDKLITRHPHVFGNVEVKDSNEVLVNWDAIKKQEKTERKHVLDGVTQGLPALLRAYKVQGKAAKVGFDWQDKASVWDKVQEELGELKNALANEIEERAAEELGDLLFAIINYARHCGIEPETALNGTNNRFTDRFNYVEKMVEESGRKWSDFDLNELDEYWNQAKKQEKQ